MQPNKSSLPMFKDWVPEGIRFWVYLLCLLIFQFSNGLYFCSWSQVAGGLSLSLNDVKMLSHATFIGLTMYFPLAFRFKFAFNPKICLLLPASILIVCNLIIPHLNSLPGLFITCIIAGYFRLSGTFECLSSLLPKVAPNHNYAQFLSFVFITVLGIVQILDIIGVYTIYYHTWTHVYYLTIAFLLVVILIAIFLIGGKRVFPKIPLLGVDWLGLFLWIVFLGATMFIAQYGNQLEWLESRYIRFGIGIAFFSLAFNLIRIHYFRHAFLELKAFMVKNLANIWILFVFLGILLGVQNVLQNIFTGSILHLDSLTSTTLKWFEFGGMLLGAIFSWYTLTYLKFTHKLLLLIGMVAMVIYIAILYGIISIHATTSLLYLPCFIVGFGHVVVFITLTVYAQANSPLKNYFQVLCILGLIRTGLASPMADAIYSRAFQGTMTSYLTEIGAQIQPALQPVSQNLIATQATLASLQELLGWSFVFGIGVLLVILLSHFRKGVGKIIPTLKGMYQLAQQETKKEIS